MIDSDEDDFDITDMQVDAETENEIIAWDCLINAVVYTCKKAYELENEQLPQAIEVAKSSLYGDTKCKYAMLNSQNIYKIKKVEEFLELKNYCISVQELSNELKHNKL